MAQPGILFPQVPTRFDEYGYPATDQVSTHGNGKGAVHDIRSASTTANFPTDHANAPNLSRGIDASGHVWGKSGAFGGTDGTWVDMKV